MHLIQLLVRFVLTLPVLAAIAFASIFFIIWAEHQWTSAPFVFFVTASIAALIFVLTRRVAFSVYAAWALLALSTLVSYLKYLLDGTTLQVSDILLIDETLAAYLLASYGRYAILVLALAAGSAVFLMMAGRLERPRQVTLATRTAILAIFAGLAYVSFPPGGGSSLYFVRVHFASSFYVSVRDIGKLWTSPDIVERLEALPPQPPYKPAFICGDPAKRPDVVFLHAESAIPPSLVPAWGISDEAIGNFQSDDGLIHYLGVEAFGGATWVTMTNLLVGLSGADFDWWRTRITYVLEGRVGISVPSILLACGYNTATVFVSDYKFANTGAFLNSIGIKRIDDEKVTGVKSIDTRDNIYLGHALDLIRQNHAQSNKPIFIFVETGMTHSPYDARRDAATVVPGEPFSAQRQVNEYLRRLKMLLDDIAWFKKVLAAEAGPNGVLVLEYGDHQPSVARIDQNDMHGVGADLADWRSPAYTTYFSIRSYGAAAKVNIPSQQRLDVTFLGYAFLRAANLASGGVVDEMERLRVACDGYFHLCADRASVDRHLRRMMDSGLLNLNGL